MTTYSLYKLDAARKIASPALILQRETDDEIIETVKRQMAGQTVEIWAGPRCVGTILSATEQ